MKKLDTLFGLARIPVDALAGIAALLLGYRLREAGIDLIPDMRYLEPATTLPPLEWYVRSFLMPSIVVYVVIAALFGLYTLRASLSAWVEVGRIISVTAIWLVIVIAWYFLVEQQLFFSRVLLVYSAVLLVAFVTLGRMSLLLLQRSLLALGYGRLVVISVGGQSPTSIARRTLEDDSRYHYIGHLPDLAGVQRVGRDQLIDLVLQTDPNLASDDTIRLIEYCRSHHIGYGFLPPVLADVPHLLAVERLGILPFMRLQPTPLDGWGRIAKRVFDIVISAAMLIVLLPLFLVVSVAILLTMGWPILYVSWRVGQHGRSSIPVLKFRSMIRDADARKKELLELNHRRDGPLFKVRNDPRVTPVGRLLRRWSIDELPQLLNVLIGHMSLVGPRPHLPQEVERYTMEQKRVFAVKPGITGLAQVAGRSDLKFEEEVRYDLQYIEEWSILLDMWVLWRTVFTVLSRRGAD